MTVRRMLSTVAMLAVALAVSACAGLPTSGDVYEGRQGDEEVEAPDFSFIPDRPQPGATPEQIVDGFIRAGSGPAEDWARARLFLAAEIRESWRPEAGVTIDLQAVRTPDPGSDEVDPAQTESAVSLTVTPVANVDETGVYSLAEADSTQTLPFRLEKQADGEWRIIEAPNGVVLDQNLFPSVYRHYSLMFFDPTWKFLVPDVRWFPPSTVATEISKQLIAGPAEWLQGAVVSGFPESVELAPASVPVVSSVAEVSFNPDAQTLDSDTLDRMQTQLAASLAPTGVTEVRMSAGGSPLPATLVPTRSTTVAASPLVLTDAAFGFLGGEEIVELPGLSDAMMRVSPAPVSAQVSADRDFVAVRIEGAGVFRVEQVVPMIPLDTRAGLIDPTVDPFGYTWSVPKNSPAELAAFDGAGGSIDLPATWTGATQVTAMAISRDGTRIAALLTVGGRTQAWVGAVIRNTSGVPQSVEAPVLLGAPLVAAAGIAWLDAATVGVLAGAGEDLVTIEHPIGGPSVETEAPSSAVSIAGSNQPTTVRLRGADGALYVRRGSNWQQISTGIGVLATQQGSPQQ